MKKTLLAAAFLAVLVASAEVFAAAGSGSGWICFKVDGRTVCVRAIE